MAIVKKAGVEKGHGNAILSNDVKSYANDPFFIKKAEEARKAVSKIILPENKKS